MTIPVMTSGEVFAIDDAQRCLAQSGRASFRLRHGFEVDPGLATPDGLELLPLLAHFWRHIAAHAVPTHGAGCIKQ